MSLYTKVDLILYNLYNMKLKRGMIRMSSFYIPKNPSKGEAHMITANMKLMMKANMGKLRNSALNLAKLD